MMARVCFKEGKSRSSEISKRNACRRKERKRKNKKEVVGCD